MKSPIYFDYAATTPTDEKVAKLMMSYLLANENFANPSSSHALGRVAKDAVETARAQVADLFNAESSEIIWTSGATESNNLALKGVAELYQNKGKHIITLQTEHPSVLDSCHELEKKGFEVTYLAPMQNGVLDLNQLQAAIRKDTILVSIMHVNNEIGVIQDIATIAAMTATRGILFHVDAVQSAGKLPIDLQMIPIDLLSFSAHKIYGPKGIGGLYLRRKPRVRVAAQIHGGGQESGMRSGTLPTHQIVGLGEACSIAKKSMAQDIEKLAALRKRFIAGIQDLNIYINGDLEKTLPTIFNLSFPGFKSETIIEELSNLAISKGAACHRKKAESSYVLRALGKPTEMVESAVRFSFGRPTSEADIDFAIKEIRKIKGLKNAISTCL